MSADLVERARSGDPDAWRELYRSHTGRLVVWLGTLAPADAAASAEDLAAEAWLVAAGKVHEFKGDDDAFAGWLFGIARNLALNARRRAVRRRTDAHEPGDQALDRPVTDDGTPDELDGVRALLALLPERERMVITCLEVIGLDVAATAQALGVSSNVVRVSRHRGLARLRRAASQEPTARTSKASR